MVPKCPRSRDLIIAHFIVVVIISPLIEVSYCEVTAETEYPLAGLPIKLVLGDYSSTHFLL